VILKKKLMELRMHKSWEQRIMRMKKQVQLGNLEQMPTRMERPSSRA
jgi:hypothetical protein